jgi:hypothetical protein
MEQFHVLVLTSGYLCTRFEVVIVVTAKIIVILDMVFCSLVDRYQCFRGILLLCRWRQQVLQTLVHIVGIMEEVIN